MTKTKFQKEFVLSLALLFVGTSVTGVFHGSFPHPAPTLGTTLYVGGSGPNNYTKIQEAINDASDGDIIVVYPKTYHENQITVDKALVITSVGGWSTTIIDGADASLADCGLIRIIASGDVTFKGFTVQNAGGPPDGGDNGDNLLNVGIYVQSDSSTATYIVNENKILGTNNPDDWEDYGFYTNSGQEHLIFKDNVVTETAANSILIEKHLGKTEISHNTLDAGCWGIDPIYCMTYSGTDITTMQKIDNNTIDVSTGVNPHGPSDNKVTAIGFSSAYLGCTGSDDSGKYKNIEISNNTINNLQPYERGIALDNFAWGTGLGGEISAAIIKDNDINGISTASPSFGIRLSGCVSGTIVRRNTISGCDMSFYGTKGFYGGSTAYPTETKINYNNFVGNREGLVWEGATLLTLLNATSNWWGNSSGPHTSGNPGGTGDPISGNVDYTPWLLHPSLYAVFNYTISGKTVTFDASGSGDYDGTIVSYKWDFGDTTTGNGKIVDHTYTAYQSYSATLTVTDNNGRTNSLSKTFTLGDLTPPTVVITQPQPNHVYFTWRNLIFLRIPFFMTIVIGNINVTVDASDVQSGVNRVEFLVNGILRDTETTAPYKWYWTDKGIYQIDLQVVAYDNAGNHNSSSLTLWKVKVF